MIRAPRGPDPDPTEINGKASFDLSGFGTRLKCIDLPLKPHRLPETFLLLGLESNLLFGLANSLRAGLYFFLCFW